MVWRKDERLMTMQPYFVLDSQDFRQAVYLQQGISHFYTFCVRADRPMRVVPDGCIDVFFEFDRGGEMRGYVCGTVLRYTSQQWMPCEEVFGVRLMPGVKPELLHITMRDLLKGRVRLEDAITGDRGWLARLAGERDFSRRIAIVLEHYARAERDRPAPFGKGELLASVKQMVYESDGKIRIAELQERTGYSERYINKVFIEEMGFPPKTFCKIIQFQRALELLNYGAPDRMSDAAMALGYYDQPQFIRDFARCAGLTPKRYLRLIEEQGYKNRIAQVEMP